MKIRKAKKDDVGRIDEINCQGVVDEVRLQFPKKTKKEIIKDLGKNEKERLKHLNKEIASSLEYWVVAEENGEIVGFGEAGINKKERKKAMIDRIYILRAYRGKELVR